MLENDDAPQGVPQGEVAPPPASEPASDPGTEQNPSTEDQPSNPEPKAEGEGEKSKQTPWFTRRIDELTFHRREAERENERLKAELQRLSQPQDGQGNPQPKPPMTQADIDRLVEQRAAERAQQAEFDRSCNAIYEQGSKAFPDFDASLGNFRLLGGLPPTLVEAAVETGEGAKVLYELGRNPDEAARILALTPARMAVAVAKIASRPPAPPPVSKAPSPIKPIAASGRVETDPNKMSAAEWMAWREKQVASQ